MALYRGLCGPSNASPSSIANGERTVNWYPERVESPAAPTEMALMPTPGQDTFMTTTEDVEPRGAYTVAGRAFAVIGIGFYETYADGTYTRHGTVLMDANPATISYNGTAGGQLFITSGGTGYCFVLATNVLTVVLAGKATQGGMLNARFLAFDKVTGKVQFSALNDGTSWGATDYFQRTLAPDPWMAMVISPPEIWLIGEQTGEVWYDTGAFPQPFAPIAGAFFKYGTVATFSVAVAGDYIVWLSRGVGGAGSIVGARGYTPQTLGNFAVDTALAQIARSSTLTDGEVLVYASEGHLFAAFSFLSGRSTWVVDLSMGMLWHERGDWNPTLGRYDVWGPRVHMYAFGQHLVGNRAGNGLACLDTTFGSDIHGVGLRRLRIGPPIWATSRQRLTVDRFELKADTGLGTSGQGADPQVMLRTSSNGRTWSSERTASAGKIGDFGRRIVWTRCGSSEKLWMPEITVSDPTPWRIAGAEIDGSGFAQGVQPGTA